MAKIPDMPCSIARTLGVLGERWTFLILRDAFEGVTRFADFRESLGVASDVLSTRLGTLVEYGVLAKTEYQEPGDRRRSAYELTDAGRELLVVLAGLREWGDRHLPCEDGPSVLCQRKQSGDVVRVGFVDARGREVAPEDVTMMPTDRYPKERTALLSRRRADPR